MDDVLESRGALRVANVPPREKALADRLRSYQNTRRAGLCGFVPPSVEGGIASGIFVSTRFGNSNQIHHVASPMGMRRQVTFCEEPVNGCIAAPRGFSAASAKEDLSGSSPPGPPSTTTTTAAGTTTVVPPFIYAQDVGGDENMQYYYFDPSSGKPAVLLTDNTSKHRSLLWCESSGDLAWSSNARDRVHWDVYVVSCSELQRFIRESVAAGSGNQEVEPLKPRMVFQSESAGYSVIEDFDGKSGCMLIQHYVSVTDSRLFFLDELRDLQSDLFPIGFSTAVDSDDHFRAKYTNCMEIGGSTEKTPASVGQDAVLLSNERVLFSSDRECEFRALRLWSKGTKGASIETHVGHQLERVAAEINWNVSHLAVSRAVEDEKEDVVAIVYNEDGASALYCATVTTSGVTPSFTSFEKVSPPFLPASLGVIGGIEFAPRAGCGNRKLGFNFISPTAPADVYVLDLDTNRSSGNSIAPVGLTRWTESETGGINTSTFVAPRLVHVSSFDGLRIPAFVYCPPTDKGRGTSAPIPVVIHPHGGPEGQHRPTFSALTQFLVVELGVCIIDPNVRGSSGYGKTFVSLDDQRNREHSVKDIGAVLDWIAGKEEQVKSDLPAATLNLDPERVGVWGGSYGGYMCLASLIHFPTQLRCGIDMVGISSFVTFLENTSGYRRELRRKKYGDESDPEMRKFLHEISPLTNCVKIVKPLMIAQGKNDPRVPVSEAEQLFLAVRGNLGEKGHGDVWYMVADNEGHGFSKKENVDAYQEAMVQFWRRYLLN